MSRGYNCFSRYHASDRDLEALSVKDKVKTLQKMWVALSAAEKAKWTAVAGSARRLARRATK